MNDGKVASLSLFAFPNKSLCYKRQNFHPPGIYILGRAILLYMYKFVRLSDVEVKVAQTSESFEWR